MPATIPNNHDHLHHFQAFDPPPAGLDLLGASEAELEPFGIPPCPDPVVEPKAAHIWKQAFLTPSKFIRAELEPVASKWDCNGSGMMTAGTDAALTWSGAVLQPGADGEAPLGPFASVYGEFDVPFVEALDPSNPVPIAVAFWVGLDGWVENSPAASRNQVLQCGVTSLLAPGPVRPEPPDPEVARPNFFAWVEWYVAGIASPPRVIRNLPIGVSDHVTASVIITKPGLCICAVNNVTRSRAAIVAMIAAPTPSDAAPYGASAEWIAERPGVDGHGASDLPRFTPITFQSCVAADASQDESGLILAQAVNMERLGPADTLATAEITDNTTVTVTWQSFI